MRSHCIDLWLGVSIHNEIQAVDIVLTCVMFRPMLKKQIPGQNIILRDTEGLRARLEAAKHKTGKPMSRLIREALDRIFKKLGV